LSGGFQKWKNKRHSPGTKRTASTGGNFENIEFILVDGRVTVDEFAEKRGLSRGSVGAVVRNDLQLEIC